jgi:hypothetical protein
MYLAGDFDSALKLYDEILEANPANLLVMKRKVGVQALTDTLSNL